MPRDRDGAGQLERIARQLAEADARLLRLAASCTDRAWTSRPPSGGWSPSECVQHLVLSVDALLPRVDAAMRDGRDGQVVGAGPFTAGLLGRVLLWAIEPPYRIRTRTGEAFEPAAARTPSDDVAALLARHAAAREQLVAAQDMALDRLTIVSPFAARVRYNLYVALALVPTHARRHLAGSPARRCASPTPDAVPLPTEHTAATSCCARRRATRAADAAHCGR